MVGLTQLEGMLKGDKGIGKQLKLLTEPVSESKVRMYY